MTSIRKHARQRILFSHLYIILYRLFSYYIMLIIFKTNTIEIFKKTYF